MMLQPVLEPVFVRSESNQNACRPAVTGNEHRSVKDSDDMHVTVRAQQVDDSIVAPDEDPNVTAGRTPVCLPQVWEALENLSALVDRLHNVEGVDGAVSSYVVVDLE